MRKFWAKCLGAVVPAICLSILLPAVALYAVCSAVSESGAIDARKATAEEAGGAQEGTGPSKAGDQS